MNEGTAKAYQKRMNNVLAYIDRHLFDDITVDELSQVAHFSKYHFHRQFSEYTGINVFQYIQLMRLKRSSYQLAFRSQDSITEIAMSTGFENSESFSRAFKKMFGQTPSQFRSMPKWKPWREKYQLLNNERIHGMKAETHNEHVIVKVVYFEETKVAAFEHLGTDDEFNDSVRKFIAWRRENKLSPKISETYNILYDNAGEANRKKFRMNICASVKTDVKENVYGVVTKTIPAGRCAVSRHIGSDERIGDSFQYLYAKWLPESGEELRDFPCFFHRVTLFPDVPEHEMITDIYLPLK